MNRGEVMTIKNLRLARAENLSQEDRRAYNISADRGMILIQTKNPELKDEAILINPDDESDNGGIRGYLLKLGAFKNVEISEEY